MTDEQILVILFIVFFFAGILVTAFLDEKIRDIRERRQRKAEYISYIERENLQLKRSLNFLKFQAELGNDKAGGMDGSVHTVRQG